MVRVARWVGLNALRQRDFRATRSREHRCRIDPAVLSEALKPSPEDSVLGWLAQQNPDVVFTAAVTRAEILHGIELLPAGKRRRADAEGNDLAIERPTCARADFALIPK